jgi:hypothetical protein
LPRRRNACPKVKQEGPKHDHDFEEAVDQKGGAKQHQESDEGGRFANMVRSRENHHEPGGKQREENNTDKLASVGNVFAVPTGSDLLKDGNVGCGCAHGK